MRRVQVDLHALSFVGVGVVNETTDQRHLPGATAQEGDRHVTQQSSTFTVAISVAYSWSIATGDLNADGKPDLVVTSDDEVMGGYGIARLTAGLPPT